MQDVKQCKVCKEIKNINEFYLVNKKYSHGCCKECYKKYSREKNKIWRLNNKDKRKKYNKEYYQQNKEKIKQYKKEYFFKNKQYYQEYSRKYRQEQKNKNQTLLQNTKKCPNCKEIKTLDNFYCSKKEKKFRSWCKECYKKISKKYYQENREKINQYQKKYYKEHNKKYYIEYNKKYRKENREKINQYQKKYYKNKKQKKLQFVNENLQNYNDNQQIVLQDLICNNNLISKSIFDIAKDIFSNIFNIK
jgi:hypothetical protein